MTKEEVRLLEKKIKDLRLGVIALRDALSFAETAIYHALALDQVGEGSTKHMFTIAAQTCTEALSKTDDLTFDSIQWLDDEDL